MKLQLLINIEKKITIIILLILKFYTKTNSNIKKSNLVIDKKRQQIIYENNVMNLILLSIYLSTSFENRDNNNPSLPPLPPDFPIHNSTI